MIRLKKIKYPPLPLLKELSETFNADNDITAAYLFGSYAKGKNHPLSDIDIAVLLKENMDFFQKKLDLIETASETLSTDEFDLVILNQASPGLAFEILNNGKILVNKNENLRIEFLLKNAKKYMDTYPLRKLSEDFLIKRIKNYAS